MKINKQGQQNFYTFCQGWLHHRVDLENYVEATLNQVDIIPLGFERYSAQVNVPGHHTKDKSPHVYKFQPDEIEL